MVSELSGVACQALGGILIAAAMILTVPATARAFWYGGVWVEPGPVPYPYVVPVPPPPPFYGLAPGRAMWMPPYWDGLRWVPGHWSRY
jgi:hypothetical protein